VSAIQWAKTVRCDWPGCQSVGEVTLDEPWPGRVMPAGWIDLSPLMMIRQPSASEYAKDLREVCSIHARATLAELAALWAKPAEAKP